jgi:hypothetical protein
MTIENWELSIGQISFDRARAYAGHQTSVLLALLATWRMTHLLAKEDGPADIIVKFRAKLGNGLLGKLLDCFYCLSIWVAAPLAVFVTWEPIEWFVTLLALSGGACLLERIGRDPVVIQPIEEQPTEVHHGVLWSETNSSAEGRGEAADQPKRPDASNSSRQ